MLAIYDYMVVIWIFPNIVGIFHPQFLSVDFRPCPEFSLKVMGTSSIQHDMMSGEMVVSTVMGVALPWMVWKIPNQTISNIYMDEIFMGVSLLRKPP